MVEVFDENKPWLWRPPKGKDGYIGKRGLRPKEAPEKVTGRAVFANDVYLPGMLYAKVYRSPHAHARIKSMDTSQAEALPGIWAIVRYDDPDANLKDTFTLMQPGAPWFWFRESLLPDTADFAAARVGALVVADSEEVCDQALKMIGESIEWEILPFILDPEEPTHPGAPLLHPEINPESNIWKDVVILNQGDVEKGFASSDHIIEFNYIKKEDDVWAGVEPGCMVADWKGNELEIWYHGQYPGMDVSTMSEAYKSDAGKIIKIKLHTQYSGACFGGNAMGFTAHLLRYAAIGARKTGRPVKMVDDYAMCWEGVSFETGTAHFKVGYNNDGTIVAIRINVYQLTGHPITEKFKDTFKTPNVYVHEIRSWWSKAHESCWKDGAINCTLANLIINKVAANLSIDPTEVQLLNDGIEGHDMAWLNENVKKRYGMPMRDSLKELIEAGKAAFEWDKKWHPPGTRKLPNGKMHGVGFYAAAGWSTGVHGGSTPGLAMNKDGSCTLYFRRADTGQSAITTYCQLLADEIGLRYEDVKIEHKEFANFEAFPPANSGGAAVNTYGLVLGAREMKKLLLEYALKPLKGRMIASSYEIKYSQEPTLSPFHGKTIDDLDIKDGIIFEKANPKNTLPVKTLIDLNPGNVTASEGGPFFVTSRKLEVPEVEEFYKLTRQCCFVEVEVDTETGQVEVTKLVHPYDVGQSINPDVHDQQLIGGAYEGIGVSGTEAIYYDPQTGVKLNDNLIGYPILTMLDLGEVDCPIIESNLGFSPYGLCGCSEAGKAATAAALLTPAVYNALGKWIEECPVTPDRVLKALGKA